MKINSAKYIKSIIDTDEILFDGKFQVAFIGRSNVGKSTLINSLTKIKDLARSSSSPGRTTKIDFFLINKLFYFVDLPGYGYARVSAGKHEQIAEMIRKYLLGFEIKNRLVIFIIDAKVGITTNDLFVLNTLRENNINYLLVANKVDKLKVGQKEKLINDIQNEYGDIKINFCSVKRQDAVRELMKEIYSFILKYQI